MSTSRFNIGELEQRFRRIADDRYVYEIPDVALRLEVDRLRRDRHELVGELNVECQLAGARHIDGVISIADFNFSSARARQDRARLLKARANAPAIDFEQVLEAFCIHVRKHERSGEPAQLLREYSKPSPDDTIEIDGLPLLKRHPTVWFGDGGTTKSLIALYMAGRLVQSGLRVGVFDWELSGEDHRDRLERLFGPAMPDVYYARCSRPLVYEADRLRRIVQDLRLNYGIFDSIAFACDGPPEAAETAGAYFRAQRNIGIGSLNLAHITKAENGDQRPFGSAFWHNGARATWFIKLAETSPDGDILTIGLFNRKANLGARRSPIGFDVSFTPEAIRFTRANLAEVDSVAGQLPLKQRMYHLLRKGSHTVAELAQALDAKPGSIEKVLQRDKAGAFTRLPTTDGGFRIGLVEARRAS